MVLGPELGNSLFRVGDIQGLKIKICAKFQLSRLLGAQLESVTDRQTDAQTDAQTDRQTPGEDSANSALLCWC